MHVLAVTVSGPGLAHTKKDGSRHIIFNDAHDLKSIRVTLMEEFFHLYLMHPVETVRLYPGIGGHRNYNDAKEKEAYGLLCRGTRALSWPCGFPCTRHAPDTYRRTL